MEWRIPRLGQGGAAERRRRRRGGSFKIAQRPYRFPRSAPNQQGTYDVGQPPRLAKAGNMPPHFGTRSPFFEIAGGHRPPLQCKGGPMAAFFRRYVALTLKE